ncbi:P-loop containing nucleoside triphosphate hydrolase protein [Zychaea mexicana]|uniref:P-loop containing nucleoside triphosphate hydrolase protein n=1 Tax=Zychaea mexicana TaxID=64656 RepID=UPI0022FE53C3|nr:P-loop containing nucleoside triphosphate hydrolase protein [Zychaea mexicana]KAI9496193.1 P-loop containing nucleoside triphosphate hydrolase protein [Zychaea mexicana]
MFQHTTLPLHAAPSEVAAGYGSRTRNLTLEDINSDAISKIAQKHYYLTDKKPEWDPSIVETIIEKELDNFNARKVMLLEYTQYLEKYLWPFFDANTATFNHVLSICLIVNEKFRQRVSPWDTFASDPAKFASFFGRVIRLSVPPQSNERSLLVRRIILTFLIHCFQSLENPLVRKECLKLVPITIWSNLANDGRREAIMNEYVQLRKLWNSAKKKFDAADDETKESLLFEQKWLSMLLTQFIETVYQIPKEGDVDVELVRYCESFFELLIDLEAQLPTRRFFNTLLDDHAVVILCRMAPFTEREHKNVERMKQMLETLAFYAKFEINDQTGLALTEVDMTQAHSSELIQLQHTIFRNFKDDVPDLPLANLGSIDTREDLLWHFEPVPIEKLVQICDAIHVRSRPTSDAIGSQVDAKKFLLENLIAKYEKRTSQVKRINALPLYPDEQTLFNDTLVQTQFYSGEGPLALPKLNLQFLTIHDYLLRNFTLFRLESSYEIRQDIEDIVKRLAPRLTYPDRKTEFAGWARMALQLEHVNIVDVAQPNLGEDHPAHVTADITYNVGKYTDTIRREWDRLRKHDIVFLLTIEANEKTVEKYTDNKDFKTHYGIKYVRGCEIIDMLGSDGRPIDDVRKPTVNDRGPRFTGYQRTMRVALDPNQYKQDMERVHRHKGEDVHETFNILVRRKPQENNFKAVLETIRTLMQSDLVVPDWLQKVFLGYGDPSSAHYTNMPDRIRELNFRDTFLDWDHLVESFPGKTVEPADGFSAPVQPPYVITSAQGQVEEKPRKKSKKSAAPAQEAPEQLQVSTYKVPNMGPYPQDIPKQNSVHFTPVQVEAIRSGMNHGLTMVVGPPGTGKTDVAVQTIANLYHNNPNQHTLIVTHSNQALNQIFEKIMELDIDSNHLVRLGHGEEELNTELSFSKYGRVSSFLERRLELLQEVDRLAKSLGISGEHGSTCETAGYFYRNHVLTLWDKFKGDVNNTNAADNVRNCFPFAYFFSNAPTPVFTDAMDAEQALEAAQGCFRHLEKMFTELEEIRAFELLRTGYDRANYLITKEAKIIAMTCTHAALKRSELVGLNFKYDNIIMEEAAQILEVETFIPMLLQEPEDGKSRLKRVILIGDHNQLPPVVKNMAFQQYGNMEQSLFTRFVRLGVPTIQLNAQGRARSSIADLYSWRYNGLEDLPVIASTEEYQRANAGIAYEYQLIDVGNYQGKGETEPVPYFYQNLGEAEYIVAMYQYMRLVGYPAEKISILTTYNGQRALINDVLERRCSWNPYFGKPGTVATVDQYQGQQNDHVLLSLVRTKSVGHIRDIRRLIVAMSRAKLGLYIFCRKELFENCYELRPVFERLLKRPTKLTLRPNETYMTTRSVSVLKTKTWKESALLVYIGIFKRKLICR